VHAIHACTCVHAHTYTHTHPTYVPSFNITKRHVYYLPAHWTDPLTCPNMPSTSHKTCTNPLCVCITNSTSCVYVCGIWISWEVTHRRKLGQLPHCAVSSLPPTSVSAIPVLTIVSKGGVKVRYPNMVTGHTALTPHYYVIVIIRILNSGVCIYRCSVVAKSHL